MIKVINNTFVAHGKPGNIGGGGKSERAYAAQWAVSEIEYVADDGEHTGDIFATGYVKWDGCSNWTFYTESCMHHACSHGMLIDIGDILGKCWDASKQLMPETWLE